MEFYNFVFVDYEISDLQGKKYSENNEILECVVSPSTNSKISPCNAHHLNFGANYSEITSH